MRTRFNVLRIICYASKVEINAEIAFFFPEMRKHARHESEVKPCYPASVVFHKAKLNATPYYHHVMAIYNSTFD